MADLSDPLEAVNLECPLIGKRYFMDENTIIVKKMEAATI